MFTLENQNQCSMPHTLYHCENEDIHSISDQILEEDEIDEISKVPATDTFIHNFLESQTFDDYNNNDNRILTIAPRQDYHPLGLFKDKYRRELNFPTLFFGNQHKSDIYEEFSYQQIAEWELLHMKHDFATHIPKLFFKVIKVCIEKIKNSTFIRLRKGKLCGRTLKASNVRAKPNLDKILESFIGFQDLVNL